MFPKFAVWELNVKPVLLAGRPAHKRPRALGRVASWVLGTIDRCQNVGNDNVNCYLGRA